MEASSTRLMNFATPSGQYRIGRRRRAGFMKTLTCVGCLLPLTALLAVGIWFLLHADGTVKGKTEFTSNAGQAATIPLNVDAGQSVLLKATGDQPVPVEIKVLDANGKLIASQKGKLNSCRVYFTNEEKQSLKIEVRRDDGNSASTSGVLYYVQSPSEKNWAWLNSGPPPKKPDPPEFAPPIEVEPGPYLWKQEFIARKFEGARLRQAFIYPMKAGKEYRIELISDEESEVRVTDPGGAPIVTKSNLGRIQFSHKAERDGPHRLVIVAEVLPTSTRLEFRITPKD